jgi:hypothetical protein
MLLLCGVVPGGMTSGMTKDLVVDGLHRPGVDWRRPRYGPAGRAGWRWCWSPPGRGPRRGVGDGDPTEGGAERVARLLAADPAGQVHAQLPVPPGGRHYRVQAAWSDRGQQWTLTTPATDPTPH